MSRSDRHVIIGASAAGLSAACAILNTAPDARVVVLSEEREAPYFRPMIPFIISGRKSAAEVMMLGQGPYVQENIELRKNTRVTEVDVGGRLVRTASGETHGFDRLLIASGGVPYLPPEIEGVETEGVYALRTLAQAESAGERAAAASHAVMLGGGLLNLKAAFALLERGLSVTLVVYSPEILSQLMEPEDAVLIRQALEDAGLRIITGCSAKRIVSSVGGVRSVVLDNGQELDCTMVFIGKGVQPCIDFLRDSSLEIDYGVVVDRFTRTSAENVFAAGDVAVTFDPVSGKRIVTGLWTNAAEMGICAGRNMVGLATAYSGTFGVMNATQVAGLPFVSMGLVHNNDDGYEVHHLKERTSLRKFVFSGDGVHLLGIVMVGNIDRAGLYRFVIREKRDIRRIKDKILAQSLTSADLMYG